MENKKHIFASHISEIGKKNPQLEQNLNVINEMADGGNIPERLEIGKTYKVADFDIEREDVKEYFDKYEEFKVYNVQEMGNEVVYYIEKKNYRGKYPYMVGQTYLKRKEIANKNVIPLNVNNTLLEEGKVYKINDFTFGIMGEELMNGVYKFDYPNEDEFKVFGITDNPKTYLIERPSYTGNQPYQLLASEIKFNFNTLFDDKTSQSTIEPTKMLEDLNLQVATQVLTNPPTEKFNFATASQNFIQQNIIGENIIFTPKFVLLESLMELNELTKGKEKDLSNDLESIINDIDSFVFEQVVTNDVKDNVREMLDNINGGNDWENAMQYTEPIKPSKSKKSKSMPNIDINNIMNNPNLPDDIRNMLTRGLESGMDTING